MSEALEEGSEAPEEEQEFVLKDVRPPAARTEAKLAGTWGEPTSSSGPPRETKGEPVQTVDTGTTANRERLKAEGLFSAGPQVERRDTHDAPATEPTVSEGEQEAAPEPA